MLSNALDKCSLLVEIPQHTKVQQKRKLEDTLQRQTPELVIKRQTHLTEPHSHNNGGR